MRGEIFLMKKKPKLPTAESYKNVGGLLTCSFGVLTPAICRVRKQERIEIFEREKRHLKLILT